MPCAALNYHWLKIPLPSPCYFTFQRECRPKVNNPEYISKKATVTLFAILLRKAHAIFHNTLKNDPLISLHESQP